MKKKGIIEQQGSLPTERDKAEWIRICDGEESVTGQKERGKVAAHQEWTNSWPHQHHNMDLNIRATADPVIWNAATFMYKRKRAKK